MYTEESLLDSPQVRATLADRTRVLDDIKTLPLLADGTHLTAALLADYLELDAVVLRRIVRRYADELKGHGYRQLRGAELTAFLARNMPERRQGARSISVFTARTALVLAMIVRHSPVGEVVRHALLDSVSASAPGEGGAGPVLVRRRFPRTGEPIRFVLIGDEPWFATVDICRILGRGNPTMASRLVGRMNTQTVDLHSMGLIRNEPPEELAGQSGGKQNPQHLNLVSEAGLYILLMRSDKPAARAFQEWVTAELLPSVRRGDADLGRHRERMAETLTEAIGGSRLHAVADLGATLDTELTVMSDGTVHCPHGEMEIRVPGESENSGPPFGPFYRCPTVETVGINGSRSLRSCADVKFVDVVRHLTRTAPGHPRPTSAPATAPEPTSPEPTTAPEAGLTAAPEPASTPDPDETVPEAVVETGKGSLLLSVGPAQVRGRAEEIAAVLRHLGLVPARG